MTLTHSAKSSKNLRRIRDEVNSIKRIYNHVEDVSSLKYEEFFSVKDCISTTAGSGISGCLECRTDKTAQLNTQPNGYERNTARNWIADSKCVQIRRFHSERKAYYKRARRKEWGSTIYQSCFEGKYLHLRTMITSAALHRRVGLLKWNFFMTLLIYVIVMTSSFAMGDYYADYVSLVMKNYSKSACDGDYLRIECPEGTSIDIKGAMYGRKLPSSAICPSEDWGEESGDGVKENTNCEAKTGAECQDRRICRLLVHRRVFGKDPCPGTNKYLTVQYQCAPKDFHEKASCFGKRLSLRCRQDTVISVFRVFHLNDAKCAEEKNITGCSMTESAIFDDVSRRCHFANKCSYYVPSTSCVNQIKIRHTCVPKQFLTSELPTSDRLLATTAAAPVTSQSATTEASSVPTTVQPTVTSTSSEKGDPTSVFSERPFSSEQNGTSEANSKSVNFTSSATSSLATLFHPHTDVSAVAGKPDDDVIVRNDFEIIPNEGMNNSTRCGNCTSVGAIGTAAEFQTFLMKLYAFLEENSDDVIIAILLAIIVALLLTICVLIFPCKRNKEESKNEEDSLARRQDNRPSNEAQTTVREVEAEEDEHENLSLLGSILQRSVDSHHTARPADPHVTSRSKVRDDENEEEKDSCGPKSIFGKICCNCCCSNAPWQRTRILKRHRGDVYRVRHRSSSYMDDDEAPGRFQSHESFPVFSRTEDNVDHHSPLPVLEDHVNRTESAMLSSPNAMSPSVTSQSQLNANFRPISRNVQRHYSVTPEPDAPYRTQQTFRPQLRQETQRSDPALNIHSVRPQYNVAQPVTAPTSPVSHLTNHAKVNGATKVVLAHPTLAPKSLPVMGQAMLHSQHNSHAPQSPRTPMYTPPPSQYYSTHQYPTFVETYEQYDNAPQPQRDPATRRKQYPSRPQEYPSSPQYPYSHHNDFYSTYRPQNTYNGDYFVQAVQRRTVPSNARTVDLARNARTVDLSHDNSLSRNSWLEIRRSSIYDNSLPRHSNMLEYYQQQLQQQEMQQALQYEMPGSRNLNHYYP